MVLVECLNCKREVDILLCYICRDIDNITYECKKDKKCEELSKIIKDEKERKRLLEKLNELTLKRDGNTGDDFDSIKEIKKIEELLNAPENLRLQKEKENYINNLYEGKRHIEIDERLNIKKMTHLDEDTCLQSDPCQHFALFELNTGEVVIDCLYGNSVIDICEDSEYKLDNPEHFSNCSFELDLFK